MDGVNQSTELVDDTFINQSSERKLDAPVAKFLRNWQIGELAAAALPKADTPMDPWVKVPPGIYILRFQHRN